VGGTLGQIGEGLKKVAAPVIGAAVSHVPIVGDIYNAAKGIAGAFGDSPSVQGAKDFLTGNGGQNALALAQGANAAYLGKKSSDYADNAMGSTQANWDERAPLRNAGMSGHAQPRPRHRVQDRRLPNRNPYATHPVSPGAPSIGPASAPFQRRD
jgi:hypothetical protein